MSTRKVFLRSKNNAFPAGEYTKTVGSGLNKPREIANNCPMMGDEGEYREEFLEKLVVQKVV